MLLKEMMFLCLLRGLWRGLWNKNPSVGRIICMCVYFIAKALVVYIELSFVSKNT